MGAAGIARCLSLRDPHEKCHAVRALAAAPFPRPLNVDDAGLAPLRPGHLDHPLLIPPGDVPRRSITRGTKGRFALLHALAHIELNAVNLALDIALRFGHLFPSAFATDWLGVADDEAKHFLLLSDRLSALGGAYGDLPAHDGLWESAVATKDNPLARLAVVPMVLEARGLDVTPAMIEKLRSVDDLESVATLEVIYVDEVGHVAIGRKWFGALCTQQGLEPEITWQDQVRQFFHGTLKRPFNEPARTKAGMGPAYYEPLADWYEVMGF